MEDVRFLEPEELYKSSDLIYKSEVFEIVGICMEIHNILGKGFNEVVFKDAMEYEFQLRKKNYNREKKFEIPYKDTILPRTYNADFVYEDKIIIEVKAQQGDIGGHLKQTINYLALSKLRLGLMINFGEDSLKFKRVIF